MAPTTPAAPQAPSGLPQEDMDNFQKLVLAGMRLMYNEKTFGIFKSGMLRKDRTVPQRLAAESAGLMKMLFDKSGGKIPAQIIAPAAAMLLMEMGKFMKEAGVADVTSEDVKQGTALLMNALKAMFANAQGATPAPAPAPAAVPAPAQPPGGLMASAAPQPQGA